MAVPIAILDPFSGISGDMTLGALIDLGLSAEWLMSLPQRLGLDGVTAHVSDVRADLGDCSALRDAHGFAPRAPERAKIGGVEGAGAVAAAIRCIK